MKDCVPITVAVFFDLGDTLVIPRLSDDGSLLGLNVLPFVPDVLAKLKRTKTNDAVLRLGVISDAGTETLSKMRSVVAEAGFFSSVEGIDKASSSSLAGQPACGRAGGAARMTLSAGSPHRPSFARHIIHCTFPRDRRDGAGALTACASTISADHRRWRE
jgi:hypothetical protein